MSRLKEMSVITTSGQPMKWLNSARLIAIRSNFLQTKIIEKTLLSLFAFRSMFINKRIPKTFGRMRFFNKGFTVDLR